LHIKQVSTNAKNLKLTTAVHKAVLIMLSSENVLTGYRA